ncbi:MAG: AIPR family protein [Gammaproteobacteria bacterium]|nr:AIPR family protein [Gammaproteobacteria bacterium]
MIELQRFLEQLRSDAFDTAHDPEIGGLRVPALARAVLDRLEDAGVSADSQIAYYRHERTNVHAEVHAYSCDAEDDIISLYYLVDGNEDVPLGESASALGIAKDQIDRAFRRLEAFVKLAQADRAPDLDQSQPASELFELVSASAEAGLKVVLNVLVLGIVSERAATSEQRKGLEREVWDLDRLVKTCGGDGDERPSIDFVDEFGVSLPCLVTSKTDDGLQVFMTWIRGDVLAQIYNTYRSRLLERNVRSFLQFTGRVNKGIRETVLDRPARFLSYNNGLSATASIVSLEDVGTGLARIRAVKDFQIVNGGQTTASIASSARRDGIDVSSVSVAMKLTVVPSDKLDEFVPLISKYANTQNRIQEADFSANHPWHIELERLSRSIWTKPTADAPRGTRWFYERSRGQYADELASQNTPAGRRQFRTANPTSQKFTKTDLAKYVLTWDQQPAVVSRGAQKCFVDFMNRIQRERRPVPDTKEFERIVGLAMLFRRAEKLYGEMGYQGYRAQVVTYSIARLSNAMARRLPFDAIWKEQEVPEGIKAPLAKVIIGVRDVIVQPPGNRNITEWCKRDDCWARIRALPVEVDGADESTWSPNPSRSDQLANADGTVIAVAAVPSDVWFAASKWARDTRTLLPWQRSLAYSLGGRRGRGSAPTAKQAIQGRKLLLEAVRLGFGHEYLTNDVVHALAASEAPDI